MNYFPNKLKYDLTQRLLDGTHTEDDLRHIVSEYVNRHNLAALNAELLVDAENRITSLDGQIDGLLKQILVLMGNLTDEQKDLLGY